MLTIFSSPKPFMGHIDVIQRNAIRSWLKFGADVEVLLIGDEEGMKEVAAEYGIQQIADVKRNALGTPLVNSIFQIASDHSRQPIQCYVNADIILLDDLMYMVREVEKRFTHFLVIGQRWDLAITDSMAFKENWQQQLRGELGTRGRLHPPAGSDYFVFKRGAFNHMPSFALGRAGWDNWMIFTSRAGKIPVVDATQAVTIIHQDHDYAHLPDGQPHYRLPESNENLRLSGGQETIFTLSDADWIFTGKEFRRKPWGERWSRRGMEASLISTFGPGRMAKLFRMFFHPITTFDYYKQAVIRRIRK